VTFGHKSFNTRKVWQQDKSTRQHFYNYEISNGEMLVVNIAHSSHHANSTQSSRLH